MYAKIEQTAGQTHTKKKKTLDESLRIAMAIAGVDFERGVTVGRSRGLGAALACSPRGEYS